jgi:ribosomal protein S19
LKATRSHPRSSLSMPRLKYSRRTEQAYVRARSRILHAYPSAVGLVVPVHQGMQPKSVATSSRERITGKRAACVAAQCPSTKAIRNRGPGSALHGSSQRNRAAPPHRSGNLVIHGRVGADLLPVQECGLTPTSEARNRNRRRSKRRP